jgi:Dyp-type peroxidase family
MGGPSVLAWFGALAGFAAPLTIGVYVVWGGRRRNGYDPWRDNMTTLGDGTDHVAEAFVPVNVAVAVLLGVFAAAVAAELPLRWLWIALVIAAVGSVVIGLTACDRYCSRPGCAGTASRRTRILHGAAALVNAVGIVLIPVTASLLLRSDDEPDGYNPLRWFGYPMSVVALVIAILFAIAAWKNRRARRDAALEAAHAGLLERLLWILGYGWVVTAAASLLSDGTVLPSVLLGVWLIVSLAAVLRRPSPAFDPDDCQPNTLIGYGGATHGLLLVGRIDNRNGFIEGLEKALEGDVALLSGGRSAQDKPFAVTIGFSARGLATLGVPHRWNAKFVEDAFGDGMSSRAAVLGDTGDSCPACWEGGWCQTKYLHVALWIVARGGDALEDARRAIKEFVATTTAFVELETERLPGAVEHFGFVDGVGDPWIDRVPRTSGKKEPDRKDDRRGGGALNRRGKWRRIALGEFVLAHVDETGDVFPVPDPPEVFAGGTFMVVRQLEQDVTAFNQFAGGRWGEYLVGRKNDGTPLAEPDPKTAVPDKEFRYGEDPEGMYCPRGAHIRRANPRDSAGFRTTQTARRRLIRRGMTYVEGGEAPDRGRGLLFVAYNARIAEQFEFVQSQWLNTGTVLGLGSDPDVIAGSWPEKERRTVTLIDRDTGRVEVRAAPRLVRVRGGEYFFVPSLSGLRALVRLSRPPA